MVKQLIEYQHGKLDNFVKSRKFDKDIDGRFIPIVVTHLHSFEYVCKLAVIGDDYNSIILLRLNKEAKG